MKRIGTWFVAVGFVALCTAAGALAEGDADAAAKPEKVKNAEPEVLQDVSVTGVIAKTQKQTKNGKMKDVFTLTDAAGTAISLPIPPAPKGKGAPAVPVLNLNDYVGKVAVVSGQGTEKESKKGVKRITIRSITNIVEVGAGTKPAEAAPAPAEAAKPEPTTDGK